MQRFDQPLTQQNTLSYDKDSLFVCSIFRYFPRLRGLGLGVCVHSGFLLVFCSMPVLKLLHPRREPAVTREVVQVLKRVSGLG